MRSAILIFGVIVLPLAVASADSSHVLLRDAANHAVAESRLEQPGGGPFHLQASIVETTNPSSDYHAEIEEYWVSPDKWRRVVQSPEFSQTIIVNGDRVSEDDEGSYYPHWLSDAVTAIFNPLPMLSEIDRLDISLPAVPAGAHSSACTGFRQRVGIAPILNDAFYSYCFEGSRSLLRSAFTPVYGAEFDDYKGFGEKQVARRITTYPEPGTTIEARIVKLERLSSPDESSFVVNSPTPEAHRVHVFSMDQAALMNMSVSTPAIVWPTVRSGRISGFLTMYVSVDAAGRVRETYPRNSDNAGLEDPARHQVEKWQFKPIIINDVPAQVDSVFTFAFNTSVSDSLPFLSNEEARGLAIQTVDPRIPSGLAPSGSAFHIRISVDKNGKVIGAKKVGDTSDALFLAGYAAIVRWRFRPYVHDGKPDAFDAEIVFEVP